MKRLAPWIALLMAMLAAATWTVLRSSSSISTERTPDPLAPAAAAENSHVVQLADSSQETNHAERTPANLPVASLAAPQSTTLQGRFVVTAFDGSEWTDLDGAFRLNIQRPIRRSSVRVAIRNGSWSVELENHEQIEGFSALSVVLERGPFPSYSGLVLPLQERKFDWKLPAQKPVTIRARMRTVRVLKVIDADTGMDLQRVRILYATGGEPSSPPHPGPNFESRLRGSELSSPLVLAPLMKDRLPGEGPMIHVGAVGYEWKSTLIREPSEDPWIFELRRGGTLRVHVLGAEREARAKLLVRSAEKENVWAEMPLNSDGSYLFEGLPHGDIVVSGEIDPDSSSPLILAMKNGTITAGAQEVVSLRLQPLQLAKAAGTLFVPEGFAGLLPGIELHHLDSSPNHHKARKYPRAKQVDSGKAGYSAFEWSAEELLLGAYELTLLGLPDSFVFDLPQGGNTSLLHTVSPTVSALVRCYDSVTRELVRDVRVTWRKNYPAQELRKTQSHTATFDEERGGFAFNPPTQSILLRIARSKKGDYAPHEEVIHFSPGSRELEVTLRRWARIHVEYRCNGELVSPSKNSEFDLRPPETTPHRVRWDSSSPTGDRLATPGSYRVTPPKLEGYEQTEPKLVELHAGENTVVTFELVRE